MKNALQVFHLPSRPYPLRTNSAVASSDVRFSSASYRMKKVETVSGERANNERRRSEGEAEQVRSGYGIGVPKLHDSGRFGTPIAYAWFFYFIKCYWNCSITSNVGWALMSQSRHITSKKLSKTLLQKRGTFEGFLPHICHFGHKTARKWGVFCKKWGIFVLMYVKLKISATLF